MSYLINWIKSFFGPKQPGLVTIVRRYITANGFIGELYIDGKQIGLTCDNLYELSGQLTAPVYTQWVKFGSSRITDKDFTNKIPFGVCFVGSLTPGKNHEVFKELRDFVRKYDCRIMVIERMWADLSR